MGSQKTPFFSQSVRNCAAGVTQPSFASCFRCALIHSDRDTLWTETREKQKDQVQRATDFLNDLFDFVPENVSALMGAHGGLAGKLH